MTDRLTVYDRSGRQVAAKFLTDFDNNIIFSGPGSPYIVPYSFDLGFVSSEGRRILNVALEKSNLINPENSGPAFDIARSAVFYDTLFSEITKDVKQGGVLDIQRYYDGQNNGGAGFVADFTPSASFIFGALVSSAGITDIINTGDTAVMGGGLYNLLNKLKSGGDKIDITGLFFNNPNNVPRLRTH